MTILTAKVAQVKFPVEEGFIEGLMDKNGEYYAAVTQLCEVFSLSKTHASRDFKVLLGKEFAFTKLKTPLHSKEINALPEKHLHSFVLELALKHHPKALNCIRALGNMSTRELFNDAFNIENTREMRERFIFEWQSTRSMARIAHLGFADACIKKHHPGNLVHDHMTVLIFGDTAEAARMKALVADDIDLDPTIGLNHQRDIDGMRKLANAKAKYTRMTKGTWQEQVERAVANSK